ncbi:nitroreductase/quinone reductase family protein [Pseudonocardia sp. CA-107938]|uniref:nitroreductase/quinone reductase family protein n=1 Tax=Pseudonocardia sp. CA-107938 TaxID=3240021 RepID=UPI003D8BF6F9
MIDVNGPVIEEFRANGGRVGGWFRDARLLLLTTTGARTGARHTVPLGYLPDGDGRVLVIGSAGGATRDPAWAHNLRALPQATVEAGAFTYLADAVELVGAERDAAFARAVEADPGWAAYEQRSGRQLPVFALVSVPGPPAGGSFADVLRGVHDVFRRELELIRAEAARSGAPIGAQLRVNCLTLCTGLGNHHLGEDRMLFPGLAAQYPEAESLIARLRVDHERIAALVAALRAALDGEPADVVTEVDRLTAELLRHLDDEEAWLLPLLE